MTKQHALLVGALGDSITTAFNADAASDNLSLSWSTGTDAGVASHVQRLGAAMPAFDVTSVNVAVAGARAAALPEQARRLAAARPDYATLLIGANDLTDWLLLGEFGARLDAFHKNVVDAADQLVAANPRVMLLLAAIPDQARVVDLMLRARGAAVPWLDPSLVRMIKDRYTERHRSANAALEDVAKGRSANVRFAGGVARFRFDQEHLSRHDHYHPSRAGQSALAECTWVEGWL